jgi:membrane protein insertase Oxa1/YidC/SpoIIIJ
MNFLGVDLGQVGAAALHVWPATLLFVALVCVAVGATLVEQRLAASGGRERPSGPMSVVARLTPAAIGVWGLALPLAVTLYYASSSVFRMAQQWLMLRGHPTV